MRNSVDGRELLEMRQLEITKDYVGGKIVLDAEPDEEYAVDARLTVAQQTP